LVTGTPGQKYNAGAGNHQQFAIAGTWPFAVSRGHRSYMHRLQSVKTL